MSDLLTDTFLPFALELAKKASQLALAWQGRASVTFKEDKSIVTEADLAVQRLVQDAVLRAFPTHGVMGEEKLEGVPMASFQEDGLWIVDPIDGTDSFSRGLPMWAISIGLFLKGKPAIGVIIQPATGDLYWAVAGGIAYCNGQPIAVDDSPGINRQCLILVPSMLHRFARPIGPVKIQAYGSNCLHLLYVARGSAQATVLGSAYVWDYFAATIILEAAGGNLHSLLGRRLDLQKLSEDLQHLQGSIACHNSRVPDILKTFHVDMPASRHGFTGVDPK